jgi:transposase
MAKEILPSELWERIAPLIPSELPKPDGGRPRVPNRDALRGILFVLKTGIRWADLPTELGCGSGMTCWRRLHEWQEAGVWDDLHRGLLEALNDQGKIDWERAAVDASTIRAKRGAKRSARIPQTEPRVGRSTT